IVAMTAHAMEGDRDLCLRAGMDNYLSKPINPDKLHDVLRHWLVKNGSSNYADQTDAPPSPFLLDAMAPAVDMEHLELFTDGDKEQEELIVKTFLSNAEGSLDVLKKHLEGKLLEDGWCQAAHKLKGSSAQIGANTLADACRKADTIHLEPLHAKQLVYDEIRGRFQEVRAFFQRRGTVDM